VRWKAIPEEFSRKQSILQAPEKGCQATEDTAETVTPTLEVIDKSDDYRYDLPGFHIGASFSHRAVPLLRLSN
jgi:hypothetical protein